MARRRTGTPDCVAWPSVDRRGPAVVLGSTQPFELVDTEAARTAGIEVVRRRSGGGAVLVTPDDPVWIDLWVPTGDDHWSADVTAAFAWAGATWARALTRLGLGRPLDVGRR